MPRPDFPRSIPEFYAMFPDEESAFRFVVASRWPDDGFECPKCRNKKAYARSDRWGLECAGCGAVTSATAGTVMHKSKQELRTWLLAAWLLVTDKRGVSAKNLQRQLGIPRYETAFQMLHKLRAGMVAPERSKLVGVVEVDETMIGGVGAPKFVVAGAVEVREFERKARRKPRAETTGARGPASKRGDNTGFRPGRVRLRHVSARTEKKLGQFVRDVVASGSMVVTDKLSSYGSLDLDGYIHQVESTADGVAQRDVLPFFHMMASNLKAWLAGTFHGSVSGQHLQAYLNEFAFRFNRRDNLHAAFQTILGIGTKVKGPEYEALYSGTWVHPNPDVTRRPS